ncbi:MAG TPA: glutaredoxin family protein [Bacteroidota bacterium]|nr:glutaredoxin family protein [Bacteroidota bacterium]
MRTVTLVSKKDCHLCEAAKEVLLKARERMFFTLDERKLEIGDADYATYSERVPVILINGEFAFQYRVSERQLLERLNEIHEPGAAS